MKKIIPEISVFSALILAIFVLSSGIAAAQTELPSKFDLRDVDGNNYVTGVRSQSGGTCWTFGAYSGPESDLLITNLWTATGETEEPNLAEYHLDWWNGFNNYFNADADDPYNPSGIPVHNGGNYHMTSAYLTRGEGAVRNVDASSYSSPSDRFSEDYHYFYVRDIEWYTAGADLSNIDLIKTKVMTQGPVSTCLTYDTRFMSAYVHYQPPDDPTGLNHAVGIIGWDDNKTTQAPLPGAWLCKNSWGDDWGFAGYFWISYYDKYCCQEPDLGAVSFYNVEPIRYPKVYYYDYHGWVDTKYDYNEAFNAYTAEEENLLFAVNFVTASDSVDYLIYVYDNYQEGQLSDILATASGFAGYKGFHTANLDNEIIMTEGDDFYIYVHLTQGGMAYDHTSRSMKKIVGGDYRGGVQSKAEPGESYYHDGSGWQDLYELDNTANFCIKGLGTYFTIVNNPPVGYQYSPYEFRFKGVGGTKPYHWNMLFGQIPYGCTFTGDTIGMISGTPNWPTTYSVTVELSDSDDPPHMDTIKYEITIADPLPVCGDANGDLVVNIADAVLLINYIFIDGMEPYPYAVGDANCDAKISLIDAVYLINYVFKSGYGPCDPDGDGLPDCEIPLE